MNAHSKRTLIIVCVVVVSLAALGQIGSFLIRTFETIPPGQTRFVAADKFEGIGTCQMVKIGDGDWHCSYSDNATPEECGSEPTVESVVYGTEFLMLIVPTREVTPPEKLQKTFTKDGQVVASQKLAGADIMGGKYGMCFVDGGLFGSTGTVAADDEFQKWPGGPLPVGRYRFELTSGTEVLSAGDFTITAP